MTDVIDQLSDDFVQAYSDWLGVTFNEAYMLLEEEPLIDVTDVPDEVLAAGFDANQARDERGRWSETGKGDEPDTSDVHTVGSARDQNWTGPLLGPKHFNGGYRGQQLHLNPMERSDLVWDPTYSGGLMAQATLDRAAYQEAMRLNDLEGDVATYKRRVAEAFPQDAEGQLTIRMGLSDATRVLDDTEQRFRSQLETGRSSGSFAPDNRVIQEHLFFGYPQDQVEGRPIYGYIDNGVQDEERVEANYGAIAFRLKEDLRSRTTVSGVDSLSRPVIPGPVNNPGWRATVPPGYKDDGFYQPTSDPLTWGFGHDDYVEAQFHGGVTLDDVESVDVTNIPSRYGIVDLGELQTFIERTRARGVTVNLDPFLTDQYPELDG